MKFHFKTERTALVHQLGEITAETKGVLFCIHGFGELAEQFIQQFSPLLTDGYVLIAPEALSRSYFNKHTVIGASWMTKHDREHEIQDYIHYLNRVFFEFYLAKQQLHVPSYVLGFSQGVSTVCRWLGKDQSKIDGVILCSGTPALDTQLSNSINFKKPVHICIGNADPYVTKQSKQEAIQYWEKQGIQPVIHEFEGEHEVNLSLVSQILDQSN